MNDAAALTHRLEARHDARTLIEEARIWLLATAAAFRRRKGPSLPANATVLRPIRTSSKTRGTPEMPAAWVDLDVAALAEGLLDLGRDGFVRRCPEL